MPVHPVAKTPDEWKALFAEKGERGFRAMQAFRWIHMRSVMDASEMTDLPLSLRQWLSDVGLRPVVALAHEHVAPDTTKKLLLRLHDNNTIETVLIPMSSSGPVMKEEEVDADLAAAMDNEESEPDEEGDDEDASKIRVTQCISTQVGCAMKCAFCASGEHGLTRHLYPEEIVAQALMGRRLLAPNQSLRNIVIMGMGEPLHNYDATARSLRLLSNRDGFGMALRKITLSTVGIVPAIAQLGKDFEGKVGLAISLHAADDVTRSRLLPANRRYPLAQLIDALRAYPLPRRRRITIEYALIAGENDSLADAKKLATLLRPLRVKINLIPLNRTAHTDFAPPKPQRVLDFQNVLGTSGYTCLIRRRRGDDISAACGQLAATSRSLPVVS